MASTIQNLEEQVRNSQGELADLMIVGDEVRLQTYTLITVVVVGSGRRRWELILSVLDDSTRVRALC
jgi:hypothetical protein